MNFKYDEEKLKKEIVLLNEMKDMIKFVNNKEKEKELEILFYSSQLKFSVKFHLDSSPKNSNFYKKDFEIISSDYIDKLLLNSSIRDFDDNYVRTSTITDYFISLSNTLHSSEKIKKNFILNTEYQGISFLCDNKYFYSITFFIHLFSILIKVCDGLYGYSGEGASPKHGDFEAQRHWMELTTNLNVSDWYTNSTANPLSYWPMDYPPMSGYHSYICGLVLKLLFPQSVEFYSSRGFEGPIIRLFMRLFALISDIGVFHIAANLLVKFIYIDNTKNSKNKYIKYYIMLFIVLISPALIIIDHGHFQFNNVMHGLYLIAVYFLFKHNIILAIIFFAMCINFKQMGMYYAIPFPVYALKYLIIDKKYNVLMIPIKLIIYLVVTVLSIGVIWSPWLISNKYKDVLTRIFPIWRGIFEDKVATFWCVLNIVYKVSKIPPKLSIKLSFILTISICIIPSICILFCKKLSKKVTKLAFFIVSLGFYLFSFHVHEKTIIVPYLAYLFCFFEMRYFLPSFTMIAMFSMEPMLQRENQVFTYIIMTIMFYVISKSLIKMVNVNEVVNLKKENKDFSFEKEFFTLIEILLIIFIASYHICQAIIPPPKKFPYIYPLANAVVSFGFFGFIFLYANVKIILISRK